MLVSIKGENLATSTEAASSSPLPYALGGASVRFNGQPAPLLYGSPTQLNVQAPYALRGTAYSLVVSTAAGSGAPYPLPVSNIYDLGLFTQDTTGCGRALAYNVHPDGTTSLNTPRNSFAPEKDTGLTFYLTGLGYFADRLDGVPWSYNPADNYAIPADTFGTSFGVPGVTNLWTNVQLQYAGPAPGTAGIDQANVLGQWAGVPQGCHVPMYLYLTNGYGTSQLVDVSIEPGGGACADPRRAR